MDIDKAFKKHVGAGRDLGTCTASTERERAFGFEFVTTPIMPKGCLAVRSEEDVMCFVPDGQILWVPFHYPISN